TYHLFTTFGEKDISASCTIPPQIGLEFMTYDSIQVNPSSTGTGVNLIQWTELDQDTYAYVLQLENLEEVKNEIPYTSVPGGNFATLYNGPRVQPGIIVYDTDLKYYGLHRLTVIAIDRELEAIYFFNSSDIRGLLQSSPDNITGARGFFTG